MLESVALVFLTVFILMKYLLILHDKQKNKYHGDNLPPGSLGVPILGETIRLAVEKVEFFRKRRQEYGPIFKTHLFGQPVIRVTGKENVRKIVLGENNIVESCYPASIRKLLGPNALAMSTGVLHKSRKQQVMKFFSKDFLNRHNRPFRDLIDQYLRTWSEEPCVEIYRECRSLFTEIAAKYLVGMDIDTDVNNKIKTLYEDFTGNMFGFPINVPGFGFHKAVQAKSELLKIFEELIQSKDHEAESPSVLKAYRESQGDSDKGLSEAILELLWNSSETVSSAAFSIIYHLSKNPHILSKIQVDLEITNESELKDSTSKWNSYTDCVVKEALRVMPPVGGGYRKVIQSFELGDFTIPKDWTVIFGIRDSHENDSSLEDPMTFNPDRWQNKDVRNDIAYLPFGGGARACPGQNYAKVVLKQFTEELCRNYSWKMLTKNPEISLFPSPKPKDTLQICFFDLQKQRSK